MINKIVSYKGISPKVEENVFIAQGAYLIGDVTIASHSSIWFNTVLRGDINSIKIGAYTNIQDNSTLHLTHEVGVVVEDYVTVGHGAILHGCHIASNCLIGMGAIILNHAYIGENCIIGAGALITEHKIIPSNSLVMGSPGKVVRQVTDAEIKAIRESALSYYKESQTY